MENRPEMVVFEKLAERFSLVPLNGKKPFEKDWQKFCREKREFKPCEFDDHNAGVACGPASGVVVLDIDCQGLFEVLCKANHFVLPDTYTVETGSGGLHLYFQYPSDGKEYGNKSFKHPVYRKLTIFDLRGIGGQVVAPGSVHPDTGKLYSERNDLPLAEMPEWINNFYNGEGINVSDLLGCPLPEPTDSEFIDSLKMSETKKEMILEGMAKGTRSEAVAAVILTLLKFKYDEKLIRFIFDHYAIGAKYREKGNSKSAWLSSEIQRGRDFLKKNSSKQEPIVELDPIALRDRARQILDSEQPSEAFDTSVLPMSIRHGVNAIKEETGAQPIMILQSILATCSAIIGKRAFIESGDYFQRLYPNLWLCTVSRSGSFKTTALKKGAKPALKKQIEINREVREIQKRLKLTSEKNEQAILKAEILSKENESLILPSRTTVEALLELLANGRGGMIMASELGEWLETLETRHIGALKPLLSDFYDVPESYEYKTRTQGTLVVSEPFITINAVSSLPWIEKNVSLKDVSSGFFARFLLFYPPQDTDSIPFALPKKFDGPDSWFSHLRLTGQEDGRPCPPFIIIEERLKVILDGLIPEPRQLTLSPEAKQLFNAAHSSLYEELSRQDQATQEILGPFLKRWSPAILKIAIIFSIVSDVELGVIEARDVAAAKCVVDYAVKGTTYLFKNELGESEHRRKCRKVLEYISKNSGLVKRSKLQASRVLEGGSKDYDYVLDSLETAGEIETKKPNNQKKSEWIYYLKI